MIIAHNQFDLLKKLIGCLDHPQVDFYIHIDVKATSFDPQEFEHCTKHSAITFVDRLSVSWGGSSMVECEMVLLKAATQKHHDYYHLLSGVDLPLRPINQILQFFEQKAGNEFIHFCTTERFEKADVLSRVRYYHFLQDRVGRPNGRLALVEKDLVRIQRYLSVNRIKKLGLEIKCGAQWFSITKELAQYLLQKEGLIRKLVRYSLCSDEVFLQTMVWNSAFRLKLYEGNIEGDYHSCLRCVDWKRGNPYTFRNEDYEDLISSEYLFARKFDTRVDSEIIDRIVQYAMRE